MLGDGGETPHRQRGHQTGTGWAAGAGDGEAVQEADTGTLSSGGFLLEPKLVTPVTHRVIFTYARHSLNH